MEPLKSSVESRFRLQGEYQQLSYMINEDAEDLLRLHPKVLDDEVGPLHLGVVGPDSFEIHQQGEALKMREMTKRVDSYSRPLSLQIRPVPGCCRSIIHSSSDREKDRK